MPTRLCIRLGSLCYCHKYLNETSLFLDLLEQLTIFMISDWVVRGLPAQILPTTIDFWVFLSLQCTGPPLSDQEKINR